MSCKRCGSSRVLTISGKSDDRNNWSISGKSDDGYVLRDANVGGGDYLTINLCLDCGQHQGNFPVESLEIEQSETYE